MGLIEGGEIKIQITRQINDLNISICDSGKGIDGKRKKEILTKGVGLSNTNERLIKMHGTGIKLIENELKGLCVHFSIPLDKTEIQK
ncbi:ATP-binding protein [Flagellimonas sp. CMM7]|uniref:ATP-binding protein n=1 Tax=Flagellimonas sp. CMM7 TaxID=2654676 RepID=UPI0013D79A73|nr:ATP-binding protein [Flagellimonas sp. CMM7]UII80397.1 ATP-binding protein [Flagellimonas sp. CMM7]